MVLRLIRKTQAVQDIKLVWIFTDEVSLRSLQSPALVAAGSADEVARKVVEQRMGAWG